MFGLMKEFNLEILDTLPSLKDLKIDDIFIDGKHYTVQQAITEFNKINIIFKPNGNLHLFMIKFNPFFKFRTLK